MANKKEVNLTSSSFKEYIEDNYMYIDKTQFIEHFMRYPGNAIMITRPRRMGKSLNLDMLHTFLDIKEDTRNLFKGLYIESSPCINYINKFPVIYLDFKELSMNEYKIQISDILKSITKYYLKENEVNEELRKGLNRNSVSALKYLTINLFEIYNVEPIIIIDEYDSVMMDECMNRSEEYLEFSRYMSKRLMNGIKGNSSMYKTIISGVTRLSYEGLLGGLNNLRVCDIIDSTVFDADFGFTEDEVLSIVNKDKIEVLRDWYGNIRIGNALLYNVYSISWYITRSEIDVYWGRSGTELLIKALLNEERKESVLAILSDSKESIKTTFMSKMNLDTLFIGASISPFYSLLIQTGYVSFKPLEREDYDLDKFYEVFIPNLELAKVWQEFILVEIINSDTVTLNSIISGIKDVNMFSLRLQRCLNFVLSYNDLKTPIEAIYHVYVLGMLRAVGLKVVSNREAGLGRFDIAVWSKEANIVFEFKVVKTANELNAGVATALQQIEDRKYYVHFDNNLPIYKVGIAFHKTECLIETILHVE